MARTFALLLVGLLSATALSGCFGNDDGAAGSGDADAGTAPPASGGDAGTAPPPSSDGGGAAPPASRADVTLDDAGAIEGPFEKSWPVDVPAADYNNVLVQFALLPTEDGAPATARVFLSFEAPDGTSLRSVTLGLGGSDRLEYSFNPGELAAGQYTLRATAEPTEIGGVPSLGYATYEMHALADY